MWQVGMAQPGAAEAWAASGACGALLANSGSASPSAADTARRDAVRARVQAYNASIAALCSAQPRCVGDGGALYAHTLTAADVSKIDDFHPSKLGQRKIAQLAWAALERAG
jgi:lysophospholipase L1-like esterase